MGQFEEMTRLDGGQVALHPCSFWKFILFALPDGAAAHTQSQIIVVHWWGLMWEEQPGLGFCSKSSFGIKKGG